MPAMTMNFDVADASPPQGHCRRRPHPLPPVPRGRQLPHRRGREDRRGETGSAGGGSEAGSAGGAGAAGAAGRGGRRDAAGSGGSSATRPEARAALRAGRPGRRPPQPRVAAREGGAARLHLHALPGALPDPDGHPRAPAEDPAAGRPLEALAGLGHPRPRARHAEGAAGLRQGPRRGLLRLVVPHREAGRRRGGDRRLRGRQDPGAGRRDPAHRGELPDRSARPDRRSATSASSTTPTIWPGSNGWPGADEGRRRAGDPTCSSSAGARSGAPSPSSWRGKARGSRSSGASWRARRPARRRAWLAPFGEASARGPFLRWGLRALARFPELCAELREASGVDPELRPSGLLRVAFDAAGEQALAALRGLPAPTTWCPSGRSRRAPWPRVSRRRPGHGVFSPRESHVRSPLLVRAFAGAALRPVVAARRTSRRACARGRVLVRLERRSCARRFAATPSVPIDSIELRPCVAAGWLERRSVPKSTVVVLRRRTPRPRSAPERAHLQRAERAGVVEEVVGGVEVLAARSETRETSWPRFRGGCGRRSQTRPIAEDCSAGAGGSRLRQERLWRRPPTRRGERAAVARREAAESSRSARGGPGRRRRRRRGLRRRTPAVGRRLAVTVTRTVRPGASQPRDHSPPSPPSARGEQRRASPGTRAPRGRGRARSCGRTR